MATKRKTDDGAALEAAILADPDDDAAYLVYGDYLQGQGDPRGDLIALSAAALRDPMDAELGKRVDRYLDEHADALLGKKLAAIPAKELTLIWHLGFVRDIVVTGGRRDAFADHLRALLAHPSTRFVQTISLPYVDAKQVVDILTAARPPLLADLHITAEPPWEVERDAPVLLELFPRLHKTLDAEWRMIKAVVDEQRKSELGFDAAQLPKLVARPGVAAPALDAKAILVAIRLELDKGKPIGTIGALERTFTADSLDRYAVALGDQWMAKGAPTKTRWGFVAVGRLGGALSAVWIADRLGSWSHQRAVDGAEMLATMGTGAAVWELYAMATNVGIYDARRGRVATLLTELAAERKLSLDQLLDRSVPPATLRAERIERAMVRRFTANMIDGTRRTRAEFASSVVAQPLVAPLARRIVWATYEGIDIEATFRIDADGIARDRAGKAVDLDGASIGILHPAELPVSDRAEVIGGWNAVFAKARILGALVQLDRPAYAAGAAGGEPFARFAKKHVGFERINGVFLGEDANWEAIGDYQDGYGNITIGWERRFPRDGVEATAYVKDGAISSVTVERSGRDVEPAALHPVTASEILYVLERATERDPEVARELAATKIEKGARVRVTRGSDRNVVGTVFWLGDGNRGARIGVRPDREKEGDEEPEAIWTDLDAVALVKAAAEAPKPAKKPKAKAKEPAAEAPAKSEPPPDDAPIKKGMKVAWRTSRADGTGVAFWIGKNKFGDGMRVGVKDDASGETVWANMDDCKPS